MRLIKGMMNSIFFIVSDGAYAPAVLTNTQSITNTISNLSIGRSNRSNSSTFLDSIEKSGSRNGNSNSNGDNTNTQACEARLYHIVKSHYERGLRYRQYIAMGFELVNVFKYCFGDELTEIDLNSWITVYGTLLKKMLPITIAYEILMSCPDSLEVSISTLSYKEEEEDVVSLYRPRAYSALDVAAVETSYRINSNSNSNYTTPIASPKTCSVNTSINKQCFDNVNV